MYVNDSLKAKLDGEKALAPESIFKVTYVFADSSPTFGCLYRGL